MAGDVDKKDFEEMSDYADSVAKRVRRLSILADEQDTFSDAFLEKLTVTKKKLSEESYSLKQEINSLKKETALAKVAVLEFILKMKSSVKVDDLAKTEKKIDAWNPTSLASREEVTRLISANRH